MKWQPTKVVVHWVRVADEIVMPRVGQFVPAEVRAVYAEKRRDAATLRRALAHTRLGMWACQTTRRIARPIRTHHVVTAVTLLKLIEKGCTA